MINGQGEEGLPFEMIQPFDLMKQPVRKLTESDARSGFEPFEEEPEEGEFDTFTVQITTPMNYAFTEELLQRFLDNRVFLIEDGREETHGPIFVQDFRLLEPEQPKEISGLSELAELPRQEYSEPSGSPASAATFSSTMPTAMAAFVVAVLGMVAVVNVRSACRPQRSAGTSFYGTDVLRLAHKDVHYSSVACEVSPTTSPVAADA